MNSTDPVKSNTQVAAEAVVNRVSTNFANRRVTVLTSGGAATLLGAGATAAFMFAAPVAAIIALAAVALVALGIFLTALFSQPKNVTAENGRVRKETEVQESKVSEEAVKVSSESVTQTVDEHDEKVFEVKDSAAMATSATEEPAVSHKNFIYTVDIQDVTSEASEEVEREREKEKVDTTFQLAQTTETGFEAATVAGEAEVVEETVNQQDEVSSQASSESELEARPSAATLLFQKAMQKTAQVVKATQDSRLVKTVKDHPYQVAQALAHAGMAYYLSQNNDAVVEQFGTLGTSVALAVTPYTTSLCSLFQNVSEGLGSVIRYQYHQLPSAASMKETVRDAVYNGVSGLGNYIAKFRYDYAQAAARAISSETELRVGFDSMQSAVRSIPTGGVI